MTKKKNKKLQLGCVFSGGGFRGVAHIGVIKAMEEVGIKFDAVSGVSAGALVASMYAAGKPWEKIYEMFSGINIFNVTKYAYRKPGILDTEKFIDYLNQFLPESVFDDLKIPLYIGATDMLNGKFRLFSGGQLTKRILASCAFPFVFTPIKLDGSLYSDGGIINNFPVEPIEATCKYVLGVYVNPVRPVGIKELNSSVKVLERAFYLSTSQIPYSKFKKCDFVIEPSDLANYNIFDRRNVEKIFELGYHEGVAIRDNIMDTIGASTSDMTELNIKLN